MTNTGDNKKGITVLALTSRGLGLAEKLEDAIEGVRVVLPAELKDGGLKRIAASAFNTSGALVFISAIGIAIRAIAPLIKAKHLDPAVVVVDERARWSISLLSGHLGGANRLAEEVAKALGSTPVITTATDIWGLPCIEDVAKAFSLHVENPGMIKAANSAILNGRKVHIVDRDAGRLKSLKERFGERFRFRKSMPAELPDGEAVALITSERVGVAKALQRRTLILRPKELVAGVGCCRGVESVDIKGAIDLAMKEAGLSIHSLKSLATAELKRGEKGLVELAGELGISIDYYGSERLRDVEYPTSPSRFVEQITGTGGVAEPAALLGAGARELCLKKIKHKKVTVAIARAPFTS
ncbi:MAG TPA: hypothetical protein DDW94_09330 [Deltaproteobacteria bacterium]|nr:MAG: hypothetical protein A2Z79_03825 [Deltaproteobacteria bacterium GWA2_55_82]OGQ64060.1 MAG: hypothetical protein A3I81_10200 [Deltaproteobacteria bacterium RIFCSPLOWO2_02_FULL_55_12]OIJ74510.1 MAG: hypothetical protein A2V21_309725 [Deltaproteobacteria bacterium GWC2_55_46]HBG47173.1 hypothetical protein [Deltaproteobacteria bacterium]HCY10766.1 hypothetical protein [Deltaproteobacteria bacterium]